MAHQTWCNGTCGGRCNPGSVGSRNTEAKIPDAAVQNERTAILNRLKKELQGHVMGEAQRQQVTEPAAPRRKEMHLVVDEAADITEEDLLWVQSPTDIATVEAVIDVAKEASEMLDWLHNFVPAATLPNQSSPSRQVTSTWDDDDDGGGSCSESDDTDDASTGTQVYSSDFSDSDDEGCTDTHSPLSVATGSAITDELRTVIQAPGSPLVCRESALKTVSADGSSLGLSPTDPLHPLQDMPDCSTFYTLLGVGPDATLELITTGHSNLLDRYDPHTVSARFGHLTGSVQQALRAKYRRVTALGNHALQTLITPKLRRRYHKELDLTKHPEPHTLEYAASSDSSRWAVGGLEELSWADSMELLFRKELPQRLAVPVLDVVLLQAGKPRRWLFSDKDGLVRSKMRHKLSWSRIKKELCKADPTGTSQHVVTAWRRVRDKTEPLGLGRAQLALLTDTATNSESTGWLAHSQSAVEEALMEMVAVQSARVMPHVATTHWTEYCVARDLTPPVRLPTQVMSSGVAVPCRDPAVRQELEVLTRRVVNHAELAAGCRVCRLCVEWVRDESGGFQLRQLLNTVLARGIKNDEMAVRPPWNTVHAAQPPPKMPHAQQGRQRPPASAKGRQQVGNATWAKMRPVGAVSNKTNSATSRRVWRSDAQETDNSMSVQQARPRPSSARTRMRPSVIQCLPHTARSLPDQSRPRSSRTNS